MSGPPGVGGESAVIVEIPEAEPLVGGWRLLHDSSAALGVPAHVTVLYPFVPPDRIDRETHDALREIGATIAPFGAVLRSVKAFGDDGVVYLSPEPATAFRALTAAVWARFPAHPPYEGRFDDVIPHLTVADAAPPGRDLRGEIDGALAGRLPLPFRVTALSLFVSSGGRWSSTARFALGRDG